MSSSLVTLMRRSRRCVSPPGPLASSRTLSIARPRQRSCGEATATPGSRSRLSSPPSAPASSGASAEVTGRTSRCAPGHSGGDRRCGPGGSKVTTTRGRIAARERNVAAYPGGAGSNGAAPASAVRTRPASRIGKRRRIVPLRWIVKAVPPRRPPGKKVTESRERRTDIESKMSLLGALQEPIHHE
jgi:hypothetical protein